MLDLSILEAEAPSQKFNIRVCGADQTPTAVAALFLKENDKTETSINISSALLLAGNRIFAHGFSSIRYILSTIYHRSNKSMIKTIPLFVIVLLSLLAYINAAQNPYWPLAVGNEWHYFNKYINSTMTIKIKPSPPTFGCEKNPYWAWFTKSSDANYWAPDYPVNLNWFLKVTDDGIVHALGHCPTLRANDSVAFAATNDYISLDPRYPSYYLVPPPSKYYQGMHIAYNQSYPSAPNLNFSCMPVDMSFIQLWNITFTSSWVETPVFQGYALVMSCVPPTERMMPFSRGNKGSQGVISPKFCSHSPVQKTLKYIKKREKAKCNT